MKRNWLTVTTCSLFFKFTACSYYKIEVNRWSCSEWESLSMYTLARARYDVDFQEIFCLCADRFVIFGTRMQQCNIHLISEHWGPIVRLILRKHVHVHACSVRAFGKIELLLQPLLKMNWLPFSTIHCFLDNLILQWGKELRQIKVSKNQWMLKYTR